MKWAPGLDHPSLGLSAEAEVMHGALDLSFDAEALRNKEPGLGRKAKKRTA